MNQFKTLKLVPITEINAENYEFELPVITSRTIEWNPVKTSLFNPVWLKSCGEKQYQIIDGFQVVRIAKESQQSIRIPAFVLGDDIKDSDIWQLRFQKRAMEGNLPLISVFLKLLEVTKKEDQIDFRGLVIETLKKLNIPVGKLKVKFLEAVQEKYNVFKVFTDANQLGAKELFQLFSYDEVYLNKLARLFSGIALKGNKLNSILILLEELHKGFQLNLDCILDDVDIQTILKEVPEHHRYKALKQRLTELRYPLLSEQRVQWDAAVKKCTITGKISVECDPYFENDHLEFSLKVSNVAELTDLADQLKEMTDTGDVQQLFDII